MSTACRWWWWRTGRRVGRSPPGQSLPLPEHRTRWTRLFPWHAPLKDYYPNTDNLFCTHKLSYKWKRRGPSMYSTAAIFLLALVRALLLRRWHLPATAVPPPRPGDAGGSHDGRHQVGDGRNVTVRSGEQVADDYKVKRHRWPPVVPPPV